MVGIGGFPLPVDAPFGKTHCTRRAIVNAQNSWKVAIYVVSVGAEPQDSEREVCAV